MGDFMKLLKQMVDDRRWNASFVLVGTLFRFFRPIVECSRGIFVIAVSIEIDVRLPSFLTEFGVFQFIFLNRWPHRYLSDPYTLFS